MQQGRGKAVPFSPGSPLGNNPSTPPGENKHLIGGISSGYGTQPSADGMVLTDIAPDQLENLTSQVGLPEPAEPEPEINFLALVREAEAQSSRYLNQMNLKAWAQAMRAFHQQHFAGSKYNNPDWRGRSQFFRPKTRSAVRKDMAAVAASLFNNINAVNCLPGNESDPIQRGAAAIMEQLINYRTDGSSGRASMPWFQVAMGARQDALLTGICVTKQSWKIEYKPTKRDPNSITDIDPETGSPIEQPEFEPVVDRPDCQLIPPENVIVDPAADWTNPLQSAQYVIIKWPMTIEEIRSKQRSPVNPWNEVDDSVLRASTDTGTFNTAAIRRAREMDNDRLNDAQTGTHFQVVWVYECFIRTEQEDYTFISVGDQAYLTDPRPVEEVYPEQYGERPLVMGYGSLEAHRLYPMAPVESWQMMQGELNDIINLSLDALKQNILPVSKVRRGRNIDLDQVKKRGFGSSILVNDKDDVTWDHAPDIPNSTPIMTRAIDLEFDDLAGQFNGQTAEQNNALSRTLGGLKLVAGSANAVQEYDIRVWIETWTSPTLTQLVRLEQWYEADPIVLGLAGDRAQLHQKHGIDLINDELLEQDVTVRVSVGLGAGDPQQRLQKFGMAAQMVMPILQASPEFQRGELELDTLAAIEEIFGSAGFRDGGKRFFKKGNPQPSNPLQDLEAEKIKSEIAKNERTGRSSMLSGLAAVAKVALGSRELEAQQAEQMLDMNFRAQEMGNAHAMARLTHESAERDAGHRAGMEIAGHRRDKETGDRDFAASRADAERAQRNTESERELKAAAAGVEASGGGGGKSPPDMPSPQQSAAAPTPSAQPVQAPPPRPQVVRVEFVRDGNGRISGAVPIYAGQEMAKQPPAGPSRPPPLPPFARPRQEKPSRSKARPGRDIPLPPPEVRGSAAGLTRTE